MSWQRYLSDVLGVDRVLWPDADLDPQDIRLVFILHQDQPDFVGDEVFEKITQAMNLEDDQAFVWSVSESQFHESAESLDPSWVLVFFQAELYRMSRQGQLKNASHLIPHPREMAQNPELKKHAWATLKQVMEQAGLIARPSSGSAKPRA